MKRECLKKKELDYGKNEMIWKKKSKNLWNGKI